MGAVMAVAALAIAGPGAMGSAQAASPTLALDSVNLNQASLSLANAPFTCSSCDVRAEVFNGDTEMNPHLGAPERAIVVDDGVAMDDLKRGATYHVSVKFTDASTGALVSQTNTVDLTTPPSTDTTPPTAPTNIRFFKMADPSPGQVQIEFTPSTDNVDPPGQIEYYLRQNGQVTWSGDVFEPSAKPGDTFTVTAVDSSNNATTSKAVTWDGTFSN
jgi:hypothetical protein